MSKLILILIACGFASTAFTQNLPLAHAILARVQYRDGLLIIDHCDRGCERVGEYTKEDIHSSIKETINFLKAEDKRPLLPARLALSGVAVSLAALAAPVMTVSGVGLNLVLASARDSENPGLAIVAGYLIASPFVLSEYVVEANLKKLVKYWKNPRDAQTIATLRVTMKQLDALPEGKVTWITLPEFHALALKGDRPEL